ncbi:hypothetical protein [Streptomyces shaanxiensis]
MHGDRAGPAPSALAAEFRSALETNPTGTAALAPHWATLTVPASAAVTDSIRRRP